MDTMGGDDDDSYGSDDGWKDGLKDEDKLSVELDDVQSNSSDDAVDLTKPDLESTGSSSEGGLKAE